MMRSLRQFIAIASLTALEATRQPIFLLLTTFCIVFIGLLPLLITFAIGESQRIVRDSALALQFVAGLVLGGYAACHALSSELRRGTGAAVLSKPVGREVFFLAKFCGVAFAMGIFSMACLAATLLSTRAARINFIIDWWAAGPLLAIPILAYTLAALQNYFSHRPFVSRSFGLLTGGVVVALLFSCFVDPEGKRAAFGSAIPWEIVPAGVLLTMAVVVLAGMAVSLATRLEVVPTLSCCTVLFMLGLLSDYFIGQLEHGPRIAVIVCNWLPNWQHFWAVDALSGGAVPWHYVALAGFYALYYLAGILALGMLAIRHMEVK